MRVNPFICAAIAAAMVPAIALADNPRDPSMRSAAARARDSAITRRLNLEENARVRRRGVRYTVVRPGARATAGYAADRDQADDNEYAAAAQDHERAMADYDRGREQYAREMAEWRRAVAACRAGDYSACDN